MTNNITVAFTGHRPDKCGGFKVPNPLQQYISKELRRVLLEINPTQAISGMALGVDQYAAEVCIELKIPFIAAVPCEGQEKIWPEPSRIKYNQILAKAEKVELVSPGGYAAWKMQIRNKWMVDHCDVLIGVFDGTSGGTANCISYAKSIGKKIIIINPKEYYENEIK